MMLEITSVFQSRGNKMTKYILRDGKAVPYDGGRLSTDTRTWRDATELELEQQAELEHMDWQVMNLKHRCEELKDALKEAEETLIVASRMLSEDHKMVLQGRQWGGEVLERIRIILDGKEEPWQYK